MEIYQRKLVALEQKQRQAVLEFYEALAAEEGVALEAQGQATLYGDMILFRRALSNLLANAVRHTQRGGKVSVGIQHDTDQAVVVRVTDNGIGPPADASQMKIGVGLGSTCERLTRMYAERHAFSIRRPPEGGTEVRITLPLRFASSVRDTSGHEKIPAFNR